MALGSKLMSTRSCGRSQLHRCLPMRSKRPRLVESAEMAHPRSRQKVWVRSTWWWRSRPCVRRQAHRCGGKARVFIGFWVMARKVFHCRPGRMRQQPSWSTEVMGQCGGDMQQQRGNTNAGHPCQGLMASASARVGVHRLGIGSLPYERRSGSPQPNCKGQPTKQDDDATGLSRRAWPPAACCCQCGPAPSGRAHVAPRRHIRHSKVSLQDRHAGPLVMVEELDPLDPKRQSRPCTGRS